MANDNEKAYLSHQLRAFEPSPWVLRFAPLVKTGGCVLDLACGAGRHSRHFLEQGYKVVASKFEGRFFFTPKKMGAQTAEANINAGIAAAEQIAGFINDGDTKFKVN